MRPIPEILPDLEQRLPDEVPVMPRARPGLTSQTLYLGQDDGDVTELVQLCQTLKNEGWMDAYVVCPRTDGQGEYICALVRDNQATGMLQTNQFYRLVEKGRLRALTRVDLPLWARMPDGSPQHLFYGIDLPEDDSVEEVIDEPLVF